MKKLLLTTLVISAFAGAVLIIGCAETDTGTNPGDPLDPEHLAFENEFDGADEAVGDLFGMSMDFMGAIADMGDTIAFKPSGTFGLIWDASTEKWICTFHELNIDGYEVDYLDSIQFTQGQTVVQYPNDSLTMVTTRMYATYNGVGNTGSVTQFLSITQPQINSDTVIVNGTGDITISYSYTDVDAGDTTVCTGAVDYGYTISDVWTYTEGDGCPFSGSITYNGGLSASCSGAASVTLSGTWDVVQTFDHGMATIVVTHEGNEWSSTEVCDPGTPGGNGGGGDSTYVIIDSVFVDEYGGQIGETAMNTAQVSIVMTLEAMAVLDTTLAGSDTAFFDVSPEDFGWSYANGWHVFTYDFYDTSVFQRYNGSGMVEGVEYIHAVGIDSVQVFDYGIPQQTPGVGADSITARNHFSVEVSDSFNDSTWIKGSHQMSIVGTPWSQSPVTYTISSIAYDTVNSVRHGDFGQEFVCESGLTSVGLFNDVVVPEDVLADVEGSGCPTGGTVEVAVNYHSSCDFQLEGANFSVDGEWNLSSSFHGTHQIVTFTFNNTTITITEECGGGAQAMPWGGTF